MSSQLSRHMLLLSSGLLLGACIPRWLVEPQHSALDRPAGTGDPLRGEALVLNTTFTHVGLPLELMRHIDRQDAIGIFGEQERTRQPRGRTGMNRVIPAQTVAAMEGGAVVIKPNCLTCHAGALLGKTIVGLGNSFTDSTSNLLATRLFDREWVESLKLSPESMAQYQRWADATAPYMPYTVSTSTGTSTAVTFTAYFFNHRDPETYAWVEQERYPVPNLPNLELDIPAWWLMKKKEVLYYAGEATGDPTRHIMQFFSAPLNTMDDLTQNEANFRDIVAYLKQVTPPRWPFEVDTPLAEQGKQVFNEVCASCHGTYGEGGVYPNKVVDIDRVGTDPQRHEFTKTVDGTNRYNITWHARGGGQMVDTPGYIAPPLDGVWATAPYLHNGSVPTLADLLGPSSQRPAVFVRGASSQDFDREKVGWKVEVLAHPQSEVKDPQRRRRTYDTHLWGKSNRGHEFGSNLSVGERNAVLEYLKTL